jgi:hypothetical protein
LTSAQPSSLDEMMLTAWAARGKRARMSNRMAKSVMHEDRDNPGLIYLGWHGSYADPPIVPGSNASCCGLVSTQNCSVRM